MENLGIFWKIFDLFFPVFGRCWPFLAVFSPQDPPNRPPDTLFSSIWTDFHPNPMAMTHFGDTLVMMMNDDHHP